MSRKVAVWYTGVRYASKGKEGKRKDGPAFLPFPLSSPLSLSSSSPFYPVEPKPPAPRAVSLNSSDHAAVGVAIFSMIS